MVTVRSIKVTFSVGSISVLMEPSFWIHQNMSAPISRNLGTFRLPSYRTTYYALIVMLVVSLILLVILIHLLSRWLST